MRNDCAQNVSVARISKIGFSRKTSHSLRKILFSPNLLENHAPQAEAKDRRKSQELKPVNLFTYLAWKDFFGKEII